MCPPGAESLATPLQIWCKFRAKIPLGKQFLEEGFSWIPVVHQRESKVPYALK